MFLRLEAQRCEAKTAAGLIRYSLIRSSRRKTLTICVKADKAVRVLAPLFLNDNDIANFIQRKAFWIVKSVEKLDSRLRRSSSHHYQDGEKFLFLGESYPLCYVPSEAKRVKIDFNNSRFEALVPFHLLCGQAEAKIKKAFFIWYRNQAKKVVDERLRHWRQRLDADVKQVVIRTQKRIWGSSYYRTKRININWKIVMMPLDVIDYVIVHELCHLFIPDHSKRFWDKVKSVFPKYQDSEQWLKEHEGLTQLS